MMRPTLVLAALAAAGFGSWQEASAGCLVAECGRFGNETCDGILSSISQTCSALEGSFGCDCSGCACGGTSASPLSTASPISTTPVDESTTTTTVAPATSVLESTTTTVSVFTTSTTSTVASTTSSDEPTTSATTPATTTSTVVSTTPGVESSSATASVTTPAGDSTASEVESTATTAAAGTTTTAIATEPTQPVPSESTISSAIVLVTDFLDGTFLLDELTAGGWSELTSITWTSAYQEGDIIYVNIVVSGYNATDITDDMWDVLITEVADVLNLDEDGVSLATCSEEVGSCSRILVIDTSYTEESGDSDIDSFWTSQELYIVIGVTVFVIMVVVIAICCIRSRSNKSRSKEWLQRYKTLMRETEANRTKAVSEVAMGSLRSNDTIYNVEADDDFGPPVNRVGASGFLRV